MATYKLYQVDAFTKEKFRGNPAGVVLNADGLSEKQMQDIAREMNCSETAFVLSPQNNTHDVWIRYFTPKTEVPICGHATIASHYVRAKEKNYESGTVMSKTKAGILPIDIIKEQNDYKIVMTQGKIDLGSFIEGKNKNTLIQALGLSISDLNKDCPIQIVSTGHSKVIIGIKKRLTLNSLIPDLAELAKLSKTIDCYGYFVFTFDSEDNNILTAGRMFAPAIGINEDPVTGNAHGPLGAYLVNNKLVKPEKDVFRFIGMQGETIQRTGFVEVAVSIKDNKPIKTQVGGNAVIVFETSISL